MRSHSSFLFDTGQLLLVDFDLCVSTRLVLKKTRQFDTGQPLLVNFDMCFVMIRSPGAVGGL